MDGDKDRPDSPLILPGSFDFEATLAMTLPIGWTHQAYRNHGDFGFVVDSETGLLRLEDSDGIREYVHGGEYGERLEAIEEYDEFDWED